MSNLPLDGRSIIVTGAAQGIGAAYARALAAAGARVTACDLSVPEQTVSAITATGAEALGLACDITDAAAVGDLVSRTVGKFGGVQGLVNNAALFSALPVQRFELTTSEEFDRVMRVNVRGSFECIKAVAPVMRRQGYGKIVNVASGTVFKGTPMLAAYVTSKGAVIALTRCLARELGEDGVRVNCIAPGLTLSEGVKSGAQWTDSMLSANAASRAIRRNAEPEDMTGTVVFLLSAASDFMTGQTVVVDGGAAMH